MSRLNDLIKELFPNGVEYKKLEDCCNILDNKRKPVSKGVRENGEYPYYGANGIQDYINDYIFDGEYVLVGEDGSVQTANGTPVVNWAVGKIWVNNHAHIIEEIDGVSLRYLYHYLQIVDVKDLIHGNIPKLNQGDFRNIKIAIPPIEVQKEIVKILDKFVELEAELEAELEVRKCQYEFWRGKLLFNPNYPIYKMEEICTINQGLQIPINQRKKEPGENRYFYITVQFLKNEGENYYIENPSESVICNKDDILVTRTGSTGKIIYGVEGCFHNNFFKVTPIINLNKRYLYHILNSTQMFNEMLRVASGGTVPDLPHKKFYKLEIGLPSIEEQNKIVKTLDKFDKLVNDITIGLLAEIELRRQQYEYYRNKLLSFEELSISE